MTIDFVERSGETEVVLMHDGLSRDEARASHLQGWTTIMDKLDAHFAASMQPGDAERGPWR